VPAKNIHAVLGNDEARVKEAALALAEKLTPPDAGEFGVEIIEGSADRADDAVRIIGDTIQALQTLPFFGGTKVVWLKSANFFGDSVTGKAASTLDAAETLAAILVEGLPDSVEFILSATEIDKRRSFYKTLGKLTKVAVYDRLDTSRAGWESNVMDLVTQKARPRGLQFERDALEFFVMLTGADTRQIDSELEKLDLYLGKAPDASRSVTVTEVRHLVAHSRAGIIFEIGDAIAKRRLPLALERVDSLLHHGENAIGILLGAIVPKIRGLLVAKDLLARHSLPTSNFNSFEAAVGRLGGAETSALPRKKDGKVSCYPVFLALRDTRAFTLEELRRSYAHCLEANKRLVTSALEPKLVLDQLLARLLTK
jgi:DNA polymerase-3 subunit delta